MSGIALIRTLASCFFSLVILPFTMLVDVVQKILLFESWVIPKGFNMLIHFCLTRSLHCLYYPCQRAWCLWSYNEEILGFWNLCKTELLLFSFSDSASIILLKIMRIFSKDWKMIWWIIIFKNVDQITTGIELPIVKDTYSARYFSEVLFRD